MTELLDAARDGDSASGNRVFELLYGELRVMADRIFRAGESATLQPTVLIHEAWVKLAGHGGAYRDRGHFLAVACLSMRQVLRDHARAGRREKRGGGRGRVTLGDPATPAVDLPVDAVDLHDALEELSSLHERHAQVVTMRVLGGMSIREVSAALSVSHATVESDWSMARAWLRRRLSSSVE